MSSLYQHIQLRRDTEAAFYNANPILKDGEPAFSTDRFTLKIGNGVTSWRDLPEYVHTNNFLSKTSTITIPAIEPNSSATVNISVSGLNTNNDYAVLACPDTNLPDYVFIKNAFVSSTDQVSVVFMNAINDIDGGVIGGGSSANTTDETSNFKLHLIIYTVYYATTTTTTTTTPQPVVDNIFSFGYNEFGQLALGDENNRNDPTFIVDNKLWSDFSLGNYHTLGLDNNSGLYSAGYNYYGQLGLTNDGTGTNRKQLTKVEKNYLGSGIFDNNPLWINISAGSQHSLAINASGYLFSCGDGSYGKLGLGDTSLRNKFTLVGENYHIQELPRLITSGINTQSGIFTFSTNPLSTKYIANSGLYTISGIPPASAIAITNSGIENLISYSGGVLEGTVSGYKYYSGYMTITVSGDYDVVSVRTSGGFLENGTDLIYYLNPNTGWTDVAAGLHHSIGIKRGYLYSWGQNSFGQLGNGTNKNQSTPKKIGNKNNWTKVTAGNHHSIALDSTGKAFTFGQNDHGQLGHGNKVNLRDPKEITFNYSLFTDDNFITLSGGSNVAVQQINDDYKYVFQYTQNKVYNSLEKFVLGTGVYVISGIPQSHPIAVLNGGKTQQITYTGDTFAGCLQLIDTTSDGQYDFYYGNLYISVSGDFDKVSVYNFHHGYAGGENILFYQNPTYTISDIDAGSKHSIMISNTSQVLTFGQNHKGQLGTGDSIDRLTPYRLSNSNIRQISAGGKNTSLVDDDNYILTMGENNFGQLGLGDNVDRNVATKIESDIRWQNVFTGGAHMFATVSGINNI